MQRQQVGLDLGRMVRLLLRNQLRRIAVVKFVQVLGELKVRAAFMQDLRNADGKIVGRGPVEPGKLIVGRSLRTPEPFVDRRVVLGLGVRPRQDQHPIRRRIARLAKRRLQFAIRLDCFGR